MQRRDFLRASAPHRSHRPGSTHRRASRTHHQPRPCFTTIAQSCWIASPATRAGAADVLRVRKRDLPRINDFELKQPKG
jgi:hypothetical protein